MMLPWVRDPRAARQSFTYLLHLSDCKQFSVVMREHESWVVYRWRSDWGTWSAIGPKWKTAEGAMNWVETTQISELELLSLIAKENPAWDALQPDDKVIVYHGTSLSRVSEFINGFDATRVVYRHYGGPKHAGVFVTPAVDVAARFANYGEIVLELSVRAKNLHGVDYSGNIGRKQDMQAWVEEGLKKKYPRSFRPHLSDTMSQTVEPQALLLGLVRPSQILRVRYKKHGQEPVWYSRQEFLSLGLTTTGLQPYGQAKPVRDVAWDLSSPRYSFDEYLALLAELLDVSEERARTSVQRMLTYGREEQLRGMLDDYHMGPKAIDAFVRKAKRALSAQENPKRQVFTPSYPANTLEEYRRKVAEGDKPDLHTMVDGGRTTVRYGETPEHQTTKTKRTRQARWDEQTAPWDARTQSLAVHAVSHMPPNMRTPDTGFSLTDEGAELKIARAIQRYRDGSKDGALGLVVPDTVWPLLEAGMPRPEATILVDRARRAFYPDVPSEGVRELAQPSIQTDVTRALKRPLQLQWDGTLGITVPKRRQLAVLQKVLLYGPARQVVPVLTAAQIEQGYQAFREQVQRTVGPYRKERDDPTFLAGFYKSLLVTIRSTMSALKTRDLTLVLILSSGKEQIVRNFSVREHSNLPGAPADSARVKYKNLQNVNLADLPRLLVGLARRKTKKGRRLQLLSARTNPSMHSPGQLEAFILAEQGAGRLVPVPGKPGRVYWFSQRRKQLTETTEDRARSWLAIAETGRASRQTLSQAARDAYTSEPKQLTTTSPISLENPMSHDDEDFWFQQYQQAPYGARRAVPAARRNPWYPGTPSLYLPDTTQTFSSLVPAPYDDYQDLTQRRSALVPGPYALPNMAGRPRTRNDLKDQLRSMNVPEEALRGKTTRELEAMLGQPVLPKASRKRQASRAAPGEYDQALRVGGVLIAKNGQPYVMLASGKARFISKAEAASMGVPAKAMNNPAQMRPGRQGPRNFRGGQFGVNETGGFQPVNRRNPSKKKEVRRAKKFIGKKTGLSQAEIEHNWGYDDEGDYIELVAQRYGRWAERTPAHAQAMRLFHSGQASSLKEAWAIVKAQAKANGGWRR